MVQFFKPKKSSAQSGKQGRKPSATGFSTTTTDIRIDVLDHTGKGICLSSAPITLVDNVLPDEQVRVRIESSSKRQQHGVLQKVLVPSSERQTSACAVYEQCGACNLQISSAGHTLALKQDALKRYFAKQSDVPADAWQVPVLSDIDYESLIGEIGYRRKVRLAVDARRIQQVKIGYRQAKSNQIVDIDTCPIIAPALRAKLEACLPELKAAEYAKHFGHVEFTQCANEAVLALYFMKPASEKALISLRALSERHALRVVAKYQHETVLDTVDPAHASYIEDIQGTRLIVDADDFIQVNRHVNQQMLKQALAWLSPSADDVVHDFFCGLGNFSLALARKSQRVFGYEVGSEMLKRARHNALNNHIANIEFVDMNLSDGKSLSQLKLKPHDLVLLDPSREGALELCEHLVKRTVARVLYVSCNPNSLMRDLKVLSTRYKVKHIGALDMFPFTQHLECMVLLESGKLTA